MISDQPIHQVEWIPIEKVHANDYNPNSVATQEMKLLYRSVNVRLSEDQKTFDRVRIAYGVAGPVPMRAPSAEAVVNGQPVTMENIEAFSRAVLEDINPRDSWRASKAFRKHIAVEMAKRALIESVKRCGGEI